MVFGNRKRAVYILKRLAYLLLVLVGLLTDEICKAIRRAFRPEVCLLCMFRWSLLTGALGHGIVDDGSRVDKNGDEERKKA